MDLSERPTQQGGPKQRHPWERSRSRFFMELLRDSGVRPTRVLDAGAGDGWFAQQLVQALPAAAHITCWDAHYDQPLMDELSAQAGERVTFTCERPREPFELVLLLDVLEHVEDDRAFLTTLVRDNVARGGRVLISVPAWPALFSAHDTQLRHLRRFVPSAAQALLEHSGLAVVLTGGLFHSLLAPRAAEKARELLRGPNPQPNSLEWSGGELLTHVVDSVLAADNRVSLLAAKAGLQLPGLSWWALCTKR